MAGRLILGALGAILASLSALMALVTPDVLERASDMPGMAAFVGLAAFATVTVGGFLAGVAILYAAALPRARK